MQPESDKQHCISDPLQDSEALLRAMIENLPGGAAFVVDPDLRYRLAEGEALSAAGFKPEDLVGHTIFEVLPPDLATSYQVLYRKGLAGEPFEHEHNAHDRFYISRGTPLRSANGEVYAVLVVSYDITERRQAEAAVAADLEDTQRLRELGARLVTEDDIQTLYQEIVTAAIALTRADAGSVQILDEATQELVMLANQGAGQKLTEHFYRVNVGSNTPCGLALTTGTRTFIDFDVPQSEDPHGSMRMHVEEGYLSAQSTPLISRSGKAIGMVSTHWRKHHRPSDRELRFLDLLARQAADLIEQRQAKVALRESEAKYRSLFDSMNEGLAINELVRDESGRAVDARYLELNPAYERQTGFDRSSTLGRLASEVFPDYYRPWLEIIERVVRTGQPERFEHFVADNQKWFVFNVNPFDGADGFTVFYDDITDRKHRERHLTFLADIEIEFASLTSSEEIAKIAGERIAEHFHLSHCLLVEIDEQMNVATVFHDHKAADLPSLVGDYVIQDFHTEAEAEQLAAGQPLVINDALSERHSEENAARFEALGNRSLVTAPYVRDGRWKFALSAQDREPRWWREDEIEFLQELAMRVSLRIERARTETSLRESEDKYRSLFTTMEQGFCIIEKVETAAGQPSDFRYLTANPAFEHHTGMHDVVGRTIRELVPDAEQQIMDIYDAVVRTGQPQQFEEYVSALDLWIDAEVFPAQMPGQIAVLFSNVSERKRAEAQLRRAAEMDAFRVKLSDALRSLTDPVEIQAVAMRVLGEHLQVDRVLS
jgi:PAS domain S-box-containing protein